MTDAKSACLHVGLPPDDEGGGVLLGTWSGPVGVESIRAGREFVRRALGFGRAAPNVVDDATLIASELLTNVALHCARNAEPEATVRLVLIGTCLRIEVHDEGSAGLVERGQSQDAEGGRGLLVVDALSDRWGCDATTSGKCVWCELTAWPKQTSARRA
jgi:anti-sigma regulatory factor (Ser/Thr protein kinase)